VEGFIFFMGEILFKVHRSYRIVVSICDKEVYGKKLEEGKMQLDLTGEFFNGEEVKISELGDLMDQYMKEDATFNVVGEKSIGVAIEKGFVKEEGVWKIDGVSYALVLL